MNGVTDAAHRHRAIMHHRGVTRRPAEASVWAPITKLLYTIIMTPRPRLQRPLLMRFLSVERSSMCPYDAHGWRCIYSRDDF